MEKPITTLGLDLGTNSLGWCLIESARQPRPGGDGKILALGTRIFSPADMAGRDPKTKASLAVGRRDARSMRRRRDRYLYRRNRLLANLIQTGLMPPGKHDRKALVDSVQDGPGHDHSKAIYGLRARALDEKLHPHEIGRVLFHLNQRRGFKSNRKTDGNELEDGKIATGTKRTDDAMQEASARTFGELMYKRRLEGETVRTRLRPEQTYDKDGEEKVNRNGETVMTDGYDFYPARKHLEAEFDAVCKAQTRHHPDLLTPDTVEKLRERIFHQRPLKPVKAGQCAYNAEETRAPKAHPLFQRFRLVKEINELTIINELEGRKSKGRRLTIEERDVLLLAMRDKKTCTFPTLRKALKLSSDFRFNKQTENRNGLEGDVVEAELASKDCLGPKWRDLPLDQQTIITELLRTEGDGQKLYERLQKEAGLSEDDARAVSFAKVPDGYGRMGVTALASLLDEMLTGTTDDGFIISEAEAAIRVYKRSNSERDLNDPGFDELPKYQEVLQKNIIPGDSPGEDVDTKDAAYDRKKGKITNPTVHIALNQLRRVVNALLASERKRRGDVHWKPDYINIELGRELKMSDQQREDVNKIIGTNTKAAIARSQTLQEMGAKDNGYYRLRLKLWEQLNSDPLNRICIYSGKPITKEMAISEACDVDHILPYSRTMDDGIGNKLLCFSDANRRKGNRTPTEHWSGEALEDVRARAANLPKNKQWRFTDDAMERFEGERNFAARQLTDMQYASRMALNYLSRLYPAEEPDMDGELRRHTHVRTLPGRMTEMLRRHWALNDILHDHNFSNPAKPKNRKDHRHHAIDAAVIACTSPALIQAIATEAGRNEIQGAQRLVHNLAEPWQGFREELREKICASIVSHKPDRGSVNATNAGQTSGKLHKDTTYGPTDEKDHKGKPQVVRRKALSDFKSSKDVAAIRDDHLRKTIEEEAYYFEQDDLTTKDKEKAYQDLFGKLSRAENWKGNKNPFYGLRHIRVLETEYPKWIAGKEGRTTKTGKAPKGYLTGSNHRIEIWEVPPTGKGKNGDTAQWQGEIVSTFDAHKPGWASSIRSEFAIARKLMSLHIGDMVAYDDRETGDRIIARVRKFSGNQIYFDTHNEAGDFGEREKDKNDPFTSFRKNVGPMRDLNFRQIRIDEIGRVWDPGPLKSSFALKSD